MATVNFLYRSTKENATLSLRLLYRFDNKDFVFGAKTKLEVSKHTSKLLELYLQYTEKAKDEVIEPIFKSSKELTEDKLNRLLLEDLIAPPDTTVKLKVG